MIARFRSPEGEDVVSGTTMGTRGLSCTCDEGRRTDGCAHIHTVRRYQRWRIAIDVNSVLPPPVMRHL